MYYCDVLTTIDVIKVNVYTKVDTRLMHGEVCSSADASILSITINHELTNHHFLPSAGAIYVLSFVSISDYLIEICTFVTFHRNKMSFISRSDER